VGSTTLASEVYVVHMADIVGGWYGGNRFAAEEELMSRSREPMALGLSVYSTLLYFALLYSTLPTAPDLSTLRNP